MKAVITIGRMNPPTAGHLYLLSKVLEEPGDMHVLVLQGGNLEDTSFKNIFSQAMKSKIIKASDLKGIENLKILQSGNAYLPDIANELHLDSEDELVVILGEEDASSYQQRQIPYIPDEIIADMPNFDIKGIPMKQAETADERVSGTLVRKYIFSNDFDSFFKTMQTDEKSAKKIFGDLRSAVMGNLKKRFPHEEKDGKITFNLPKNKKGELNAAANKVIDSIFSKLQGYNREIVWENVIKENQPMPEPGTGMRYIDLMHPINMNKDLVSSFGRNQITNSTITDTDGNEISKVGKYGEDMWNRFKGSISRNGITDPIIVKIESDYTCKVAKGNHRLHAIGDDYPKKTIPVRFQLHPDISFKGLNRLIKSWLDSNIIDSRDYTGFLNQLNTLQVENVLHLPDKLELLSEGGKVECKICGAKLHRIYGEHLKKHQITEAEYKGKFPGAPLFSEKHGEKLSNSVKDSYNKVEGLRESRAKDFKDRNKANQERLRDLGYWTSKDEMTAKELYKNEVIRYTNKSWSEHFDEIPNAELRGSKHHLDHKFSIHEGFMQNVHPVIIGHYKNLEVIPKLVNETKVSNCSITLEQLKKDIESIGRKLPLLNEGGAFGHMAHGYEVFKGKDIFNFFDNIFTGKYEMYEKVDGQNIVFGLDLDSGKVVFDFGGKNGRVFDVAEKYSIYHPAGDAFRAGTQAIREAVEKMDPSYIRALGLTKGNMINAEVIYGEIPNTVPYSKTLNYIVLHNVLGDHPIKNEKELLIRLGESIGIVVATAPVINYEGDDLSMVKASTTMSTSKWKFVGPMKIDLETVKEKLGDEVEKWKQYPEAQRLMSSEKLSEEQALQLAKELSVKISSVILNKMVSQLRDPDAQPLPGVPGIEGIALYDKDSLYKVTGDFYKTNRAFWKPIEDLKAIESNFWEYIAQDVLGLKTKKVGPDIVTRFNGDAEKYLKTKSAKFAMKRGVALSDPNNPVNTSPIINKIDSVIEELKRLYSEIEQSDSPKKSNIMKSIKITAFRILRTKKLVQKSKTYKDIAISSAKGMEIMEGLYRLQLKDILEERLGKNPTAQVDVVEVENNNGGKFLVSRTIIEAVKASKKEKRLLEFLKRIPGGTAINVVQNLLNDISDNPQLLREFVTKLWSKKLPEKITPNDYSDGIGGFLFQAEPKGVGKGELMLAFYLYDSEIQGGSESFDLLIGGTKRYEVKDYSSAPGRTASIRLGTEGKVTRFKFWHNILEFLSKLEKVYDTYGSFDMFGEELAKNMQWFASRSFLSDSTDIRSGEFNKKDMALFKKVHQQIEAFSLEKAGKVSGFTKVKFMGPNVSSQELNIKPVKRILKKGVTVEPVKEEDSIVNTIIDLKHLRYVNNIEQFDEDMQAAVDGILEALNGKFIVFRKGSINITTEFKPALISQGGLKIIEKEVK